MRGVGFEPTQAFANGTSLRLRELGTEYPSPLSWLGHPRRSCYASQTFNFFVLVFMFVLTLFLMANLGDLTGEASPWVWVCGVVWMRVFKPWCLFRLLMALCCVASISECLDECVLPSCMCIITPRLMKQTYHLTHNTASSKST